MSSASETRPSGTVGEIGGMAPTRSLSAEPEWSLVLEDGVLVLSGGADALFAFPDIDAQSAAAVLRAWSSGAIDAAQLPRDARDVIHRLRDVGAVRGEPLPVTELDVAVRFVGTPLDRLGELRRDAEGPSADLVVIVRTNAELKSVCGEGYERLRTPHLLLDLGFRHTISIGPLVFPGETACLACLVGRIAHYWGDARPPDRPAALRHALLAAELLALEIEHFAAGDFRLVNETVSFDLDRLETRRTSVYRLPWCPTCGEHLEPVGSIPLPWEQAT